MKHINNLVEDLKNIYGENLVSVLNYGEKQEILVVFNQLSASELKKAIPAMKKWLKTKNPLPVVMSEIEWQSSADVYPIEYTEIKNSYKILYGKDVVESVTVSKQDLRLQCEYEIKNILVRIRQMYLGNSDNTKFMERMLKETTAKLIRILKSASILSDAETFKKYSKEFSELTLEKKNLKGQEIENIVQKMITYTDSLYNFINDLEI